MKQLYEYILESNQTSSNKERLEQLRKWLKGKDYEDYVDTLNKMLEDPKAKTLLDEGFGTEFGDVKFTYRVKLIKAKNLRPSQNEIDIDKTIGISFLKPDNVASSYAPSVVIANMPLVTFNGEYIIDGHHRWSEVATMNPDGKMLCFDYSADITIEEMLKAVQGTIAAVMANKGEKVPSQHVKSGNNIYDLSKEQIEKYIDEHENDETYERIVLFNRKVKSKEQAKDFIIQNLLQLKHNNKPDEDAPERGYMPQTSKCGSDINNKQTAFPDKVGSVLYKLSRKKVDKKSIE